MPLGYGTGGSSVAGGSATAANQTTEIARLDDIELDLDERYGGGKTAAVAQVTASGDTTILTPSSGKALKVYWVTAINDPDQSQSPRIQFKFESGSTIYSAYAVAHWEVFTGGVNKSLIVNLDQSGDVAVTVHYVEV